MLRNMKVCVTGACGKIAYSLYGPLCSGAIFGPNVGISLRLVDISQKRDELKILRGQLDDCCFNQLISIEVFDQKSEHQPYDDIDLAIFLGGMPRKPGMDKKQVFQINAQIFQSQGKFLEKAAKKSCKSLVIANPTCTNCLILANNAPSIPKQNFTALTRLDYNKFLGQASKLFNCLPGQLKNVILWGNHSRKQYCDVNRLSIEGFSQQFISEKIKQLDLTRVEKIMYDRGGFILEKSNGNSYISATQAIIDHLKDWFLGSDRIVSMGVVLSVEKFGIQAGLCFSLPTKCTGNGEYEIVENFQLNEYQKKRISQNRDQLIKQRNFVENYLINDS